MRSRRLHQSSLRRPLRALLLPGLAAGAVGVSGLALAPQAATPPSPLGAGFTPKQLDGAFDDWVQLPAISTNRDERDAQGGAPELLGFSLACDRDAVWMYLEFANEVNLQGLDVPLYLYVDLDTPSTGVNGGHLSGADIAIIFSPTDDIRTESGSPRERSGTTRGKNPESGQGVVVRKLRVDGSLGEVLSAASFGLAMAPAHASTQFELRMDRTATAFAERSAAMRPMLMRRAITQANIVKKEGEAASEGAKTVAATGAVEILEETPITRLLLLPRPANTPPAAKVDESTVALPPAPTGAGEQALRVASWNAELGAPFKTPAPFGATIKAIRPDVVLWQELGKEPTSESLAAWMNSHVGEDGGTWTAVVSGGDLRTGVVARGTLRPAPFLDGLKRHTEKGDRDVRVVGAILERDGKRYLLASLHLKCCGRIGSSEDETRMAEATAIREAIANAAAKMKAEGTPLDGIVVAGDFNLVGAKKPVELVGEGTDLDGTNLEVVPAFELDHRSNATWRSTGNDFLPGRLDWMLYTGSRATVRTSFVFSADDLNDAAVAALGLPESALKEPSDHQPVVADFLFTAPKGGT